MKWTRIVAMVLLMTVLVGCASAAGPAPVTEAVVPAETTPVIVTENELGQFRGLDYELWKDYGETQMTLTEGGFQCRWDNINNALFRMGRKFACTNSWQDYGTIAIDYSAEYYPVGNSYLCVYGWTREPLAEYYVVQSWGNWRPPGAEALGTIQVDGATYDVYCTQRVNQPSIDGTATFPQYWSVRKGKDAEGTVTLTEHFAAWEEMGLELGLLYEAALTVEGYQSSGFAEITKNEITVEHPEPAGP